MKTASYATALADIDAIKASIATVAAPVTYSGGQLDGVIGATSMAPARTVSVTTASNSGSYTAGSALLFTGTDAAGRTLTETLLLTAVNGGETIYGTKGFKTVTSVAIEAQFDTGGHFSLGVRDVMCDKPPYMIRANGAGNLHVAFDDGSEDTIPAMAAKEYITFAPVKVFGDSGTTITGLTLFFH